mmetsp:Transcript_23646/g.67876  ORF Transcript_23646/g.67876 Transcript_23646/m.67876 type:complete len:233 (-) Transcript_23646:326-1024(-)
MAAAQHRRPLEHGRGSQEAHGAGRRKNIHTFDQRELAVLKQVLRQQEVQGLADLRNNHQGDAQHCGAQLAINLQDGAGDDHKDPEDRGPGGLTASEQNHHCQDDRGVEGLEHLDESDSQVQVCSIACGEGGGLASADWKSHPKPFPPRDDMQGLRPDVSKAERHDKPTEDRRRQHTQPGKTQGIREPMLLHDVLVQQHERGPDPHECQTSRRHEQRPLHLRGPERHVRFAHG